MKPLALLLISLLTGCATWCGPVASLTGPPPANAYRAAAKLPAELRRVAVLPVTVEGGDLATQDGRDALEPVLRAELRKRGVFELIFVSPEQLRSLTGRATWTAEESLPADLLATLRERLDCDGVLFSRLTQFRAYPPLTVGWGLKLVDCRQRQIVWAADEVSDAGQPAVAAAARRFASRELASSPPLHEPGSILISPRQFGQFAAANVLETLPGR